MPTHPASQPRPRCRLGSLDTGMNTLINYLIGISVGAVGFSIVMILIFMLPLLMDKSAGMKVGGGQ